MWGWQFRADPARAPEFLGIRHASAEGLSVTGSGATTITTAPLFRRGETVSVTGAGGPALLLKADCDGRLTFTIDLGPAHSLEQDTATQLAAAAADPNYFVTRSVTLTRIGVGESEEHCDK